MNYIWKEWMEQSRGKGLWLTLFMVIILSFFIFLETRALPSEHGFTVLLLSLYDMNAYLLPLLSLFLASFAVIQEKELKTLMMLTTKKESYRSFLFKKSIAIQSVTLAVFVSWYLLFAIPLKFYFQFDGGQFMAFLLSVIVLLTIFNQIGICLGSVCRTRMQLIGANIFVWFFFIVLADLLFLYILPNVTYENIKLFSVFFFLDPIRTVPFYLESALGIISMEHMSRIMGKMVWTSPSIFLLVHFVIWIAVAFEVAVLRRGKREQY